MLVKQISIFIPNEKGSLAKLTSILVKNHIDIRAISVFDTTEFGILRMVVDNPEETVAILTKEGVVAKISDVLAVEPEDKPGSLDAIFQILSENDINIDYIYSYVMRMRELPYIVLKTDHMEKAAKVLSERGIKVIQ
ncbi:ACT domain-containing protein [Sinanaerobacter sp. ZZT-01]|uniref:ACT domain-containing protein n=1 Tax=Sinanaerobacter sp. ZZT-01 TaxID=3111540 RepID=UPI002D795D9C|nr:ACT domain-containing protein [Sinanaerobacter sp. ZZT-01]WRR94317.1 ACT domain-containing protein [Sinanaerobacter sp. ZZT-01]